jgi:molybdopterin-guanine dinucleotide biosynthesis protein B
VRLGLLRSDHGAKIMLVEQRKTPPIISIIGRSGSGKTTFLTKLIAELKLRGYRVAVLKHHRRRPQPPSGSESKKSAANLGHRSESTSPFDTPGKDTWRHFRAGADTVIISSHDQMAMYHRLGAELTPDELASLLPSPVDIVLTEGFTSAGTPAIEIRRKGLASKPVTRKSALLALVSDTESTRDIPQFALDDAAGVAALLERLFSLVRGDPDTRPPMER